MRPPIGTLLLSFVLGLSAACRSDKGGAPGAAQGGSAPGGSASPGGSGRRGPMAFPVEVRPVEARDVEYTVTAVGSVDAFERVQVTARVAGVVEQVRFAEGQTVEKDASLAEIDPSRFRLAVRAAQAALDKARAAKAEAQAGRQRRESVEATHPGLIRGEELESWRTRAASASAELASAQVALEQAQLNLRDAFVRAPIDGVIQTRTVQTGQYVQVGAVLATLVRRDPLLLRFSVAEDEAQRLVPGGEALFVVKEDPEPKVARITHVAEAAEEASRMVRVVGEVLPEHREGLRPGTFADVRVPVGRAAGAPVIPQTAVRASERGFIAHVVQDGVAKERVVRLGLRTREGLVEVREGLRPGEQVVVRGGEALRDGAPVRVVTAAAGAAAPTAGRDGGDGAMGRPAAGGSP